MFEIYAFIYDRKHDLYIEYKPTGLLKFDKRYQAEDRCSYLNAYYGTLEIRFSVREV